jgi:O-antigen ligase
MSERRGLDTAGHLLIVVAIGIVQFKLSYAQVLFGLAALCWVGALAADRERPRWPAFFLPLALYALLTLASAAFSADPIKSLIDCKQLLLFLIVPVVMRFASGARAGRIVDVAISFGGGAALIGIVQFLIFGYDNLDQRPVGTLSHYMTYSGVLMLVVCAAVARLLFSPRPAAWPAVAVPALLVALYFTLTRNAWLGTGAAIALLFALRNWKLLLALPVAAAIAFIVAPGQIQARITSIGDTSDPANRDRLAMLTMGRAMIADHPIFGVGPEMVEVAYPQYRVDWAVNPTNPHLHNVPMQIAAERGLPALAVWLWFIVVAARDLLRLVRAGGTTRPLAAGGLAAIVAMLVAGFFEYNFGDSEFLMLFLGLITAPFAATRPRAT